MSNTTQYLTLGIADELLAIPVDNVQEILELRSISRLPHAPDHLLGMIDVRGQGVPVIDLRRKLGFTNGGECSDTENTRIIVLVTQVKRRELIFGLKTDRVFEVTLLDSAELDAPPEIGGKWENELIAGIGRRNSNFVTVLNLAYLFKANEVDLMISVQKTEEHVA